MVIGSHDEMKAKFAASMNESMKLKITAMMNSTVSENEMRQRITNSTIDYFTRVDGGIKMQDKITARHCLSQILTNACNVPFEEVHQKLNATFDVIWNGASKHSDGTLHIEHFNAFFNTALNKL